MVEMTRSMQIQLWSLGFLPLCGCRPLAKAIHPSASASGLFPLWLRAPRFVCAALSSHSALLSGARGGSRLGRGRNPLPSSGFILVPSDSTQSTTPLLVFISVGSGIASASNTLDFDEGRRSSFAIGRQAETAPRRNANACPKSARLRADFSRPCAHARTPFKLGQKLLLMLLCLYDTERHRRYRARSSHTLSQEHA